MKLSDIISEDAIEVEIESRDKDGVIGELVGLLSGDLDADGSDALLKSVMDREELMSTGIGQGIAIPHAKTSAVDRLKAAFGRSVGGVDFKALDGKPVHIFFLLVAPENQSGPHVKALARISRLLKHAYFRQALRDAESPREVLAVIREEEMKHL